jgi:L-2,4-diaminobutyrate decarboxylase
MYNILCFRHLPGGAKAQALSLERLNAHQANVRRRVVASGKFYLVQTYIGRRLHLRCTLMNAQTTAQDLARLLDVIRECAAD